MNTYRFPPRSVNAAGLDMALRNALQGQYDSLLKSDSELRVFLNSADVSQEAVQAILDAHDPSVLTAEQEAEKDRLEALATAREANGDNLDASLYESEAPLMRQLAQKIVWLEREIRDLRDL